jgi:energy-coupling factor transport system substrate-specific component
VKLLLVSLVGLALFFWPFLGGAVPGDAPAVALAAGAILALLLIELGTRELDSRGLALLAALAAVDAALRLAVVVGIGGWSPIFFLILVAGYVFGPGYGFLVGAFSLLVSAVATGGMGPWISYQVFAVGWIGAAAGIAGRWRSPRFGWRDAVVLAAVGAMSGWAFGALMDIQVWVTGFRGPGPMGWIPGLDPATSLVHFGRFYLLTSLAYDTFRAAGNAIAVLVLAAPVVAALERVRARMSFTVVQLDSA